MHQGKLTRGKHIACRVESVELEKLELDELKANLAAVGAAGRNALTY